MTELRRGAQIMSIKTIGQFQGEPVQETVLTSDTGVEVTVMSYGAIVRDWRVPVNGEKRSVVLGFPDFETYLKDDANIGAIVGRVANRIGGAQFSVNERTYKLPANVGRDHLHGGPEGFSHKNWKIVSTTPSQVVLSLHSPEGEMGYPGALDVTATYTLLGYTLNLVMEARATTTTPVSLVQHHYFNLMGHGDILDHVVTIPAQEYTPLSEALITTGEIASVENTRFDFRNGKNFRDSSMQPIPYDINFLLPEGDRLNAPVAMALAPDQSLQLRLWSDQKGLQLYTGEYLKTPYAGFCLEDQALPDAVNKEHFPSILIGPESDYRHWCNIEIKSL